MTDQISKLKHVAIIPDGNRRWAKAKGLPTFEGHRRGFEVLRKVADYLRKEQVKILTVWAFSTENWNRDSQEIEYLMGIFEKWLDQNLKTAQKDKIRIIHLGRKDHLRPSLRNKLEEVEEKTKNFDRYYLGIALDYGGRDELIRAVDQMKSEKSKVKNMNEEEFEKYLDTKDFPYPNPDLVIRTSGEYRTSGFMSWQASYSEWIFHPSHLPDFSVKDLKKCIEEYHRRQRRFGK